MHNTVLGVLVGSFLTTFGAAVSILGVVALFMSFSEGAAHVLLWAFIAAFLTMGPLSLGVGILVMLRTIASLRGTSPTGARWERWAARIDKPLFS
jgi:hypothetical protein